MIFTSSTNQLGQCPSCRDCFSINVFVIFIECVAMAKRETKTSQNRKRKKNKTTTQRPVETMSSRRMATKERRKQKETRLNFITWGEYSPLRDSRSPMTAGGRGGGHGGPLTDWASRGDRDNHQIRKKNKKIKIKIKKSNQINRTAFVPFVHFLFFWFFFFFFFFCDHFSLGLWILLVLLGFTGFYWVLPSFT